MIKYNSYLKVFDDWFDVGFEIELRVDEPLADVVQEGVDGFGGSGWVEQRPFWESLAFQEVVDEKLHRCHVSKLDSKFEC